MQAFPQVVVALATEQHRQRAHRLRRLAVHVAPHLCHAQPQRLFGAGQRHIKETDVFAQALGIAAVAVLFFLLEQRHKRQKHQRVFEPLGLVKGHHLHQIGLALQPQLRAIALRLGVAQLVFQVPDQRALALHLQRLRLQQLAQVQQVGQRTLALRRVGQQFAGQALIVQQAVEHRQEALCAPDALPEHELFDQRVPRRLVGQQRVQYDPAQAPGARDQRRTQQAVAARVGHGAQDAPQVSGLVAFKNTVALGQINAAHAARVQRAANCGGLGPVTYQHRHVATARRTRLQQRDHLAGENCSHFGHKNRLGWRFGKRLVPHGHRHLRLARHLQRCHPALARCHRQKRDTAKRRAGLAKHGVDGVHNARRRAEIDRQRVDALRLRTGGQVGGQIGTAKAVNSLLGVADHDQRVGCKCICRFR